MMLGLNYQKLNRKFKTVEILLKSSPDYVFREQ